MMVPREDARMRAVLLACDRRAAAPGGPALLEATAALHALAAELEGRKRKLAFRQAQLEGITMAVRAALGAS